MAQKEGDWCVQDMLTEIEQVPNSWAAKIPGVNGSRELKQSTKMHQSLLGICKVMGGTATAHDLEDLNEKQKLECAIAGETSTDEIDALVQQFQMMDLMHRLVRQRQSSGKPLPLTQEAMQTLVQTEGLSLLSKPQKTKLMKRQAKDLMKGMKPRQR